MLVDLSALAKRADCRIGMCQCQLTSLRVHDVEVKFVREVFVQLHGFTVELHPFGRQVIRANDGGVSRRVATTQIPLFQHRDVGNAMILGEVIGSRHSVTATANDHNVILTFEVGRQGEVWIFLKGKVLRKTVF